MHTSLKAGPSDQEEDGAQLGLLAAQHVQGGEEKGAERTLVRAGQADSGNRGLGPTGQQKWALHVKIQIRKIAFYSVCI